MTEEIFDDALSAGTRQSLLLNLALCHRALDEIDEAKAAARRVVQIDRHSRPGLQARSLLIELATDDPKRQAKLEAMEIFCRRHDAIVVANNIALVRAREGETIQIWSETFFFLLSSQRIRTITIIELGRL